MRDWQDIAVLVGAVVFMVFLLWRMRPVRLRRGFERTIARGATQARIKARDATDPHERARLLCEGGSELSGKPRGTLPALGLYLRALRADPTWPEPVHRLRKLLWSRRPKDLERILWRRLGATAWEGSQRAVAAAAARSLSDLYRTRLRNQPRAQVLDRLALFLENREQNSPPTSLS